MAFLRNAALFVAIVALSGCALFEGIANGLARITRENADRPYFAYSLRNEADTRVFLATITEDRKGLLRGTVDTELGSADLFIERFSPSQVHLAVNFVEYIGLEIDLGFQLIDVEARAVVGSATDTTMDSHMERNCRALRETKAQAILDAMTEGTNRVLTLRGLRYEESRDQGFIAASFWVSNSHMVASYSLPYTIEWIDQDGTLNEEPFVSGKSTPITGEIDFRRGGDGVWRKRGCGATATRPPLAPETAQLRVDRTGKLLLDGAELDNRLTPGTPLETRRAFDASRWTSPL